MNTFFCRAFQCCFAVGARFLPWRTPEVFSGEGAFFAPQTFCAKTACAAVRHREPPPVCGRALPRLAGKT